jgi:cation transport protein ChaC
LHDLPLHQGHADDLWIFGYGSLMWRPGFAFEEVRRATLIGFRRCFCVFSTHHRGTPQRPGLVLGLDRGGVCHGLAYRVASVARDRTLEYLRAREQVNGVYREAPVQLQMHGAPSAPVTGLAYIVERAHPSYAGRLAVSEQARLIRGAHGISGANLDYLINTLAHLGSLSIREAELSRVLTVIGAHFARGQSGEHGSVRAAALLPYWRNVSVRAPRMKPLDRRRFVYRRQISAWTARSRDATDE